MVAFLSALFPFKLAMKELKGKKYGKIDKNDHPDKITFGRTEGFLFPYHRMRDYTN